MKPTNFKPSISEDMKAQIRSQWRQIILNYTDAAKEKRKNETTYICPFCGHGKGGDGIVNNPNSKDGNTLKCFGCDFSGDIIDLISRKKGIDFVSAAREAAGIIGIDISAPTYSTTHKPQASPTQQPTAAHTAQQEAAPIDYTEYYKQCMQANTGTYLISRGISKATQDIFFIGYDEKYNNLIVPLSPTTYKKRQITPSDNAQKANWYVNKGGSLQDKSTGFLGEKQMQQCNSDVVFITEAEVDALSVWECGYPAVAVGSTSRKKAFISVFLEKHPEKKYILSLDNDNPGQQAQREIAQAMTDKKIVFIEYNISADCKDQNERLVKDRTGFEDDLREAYTIAKDYRLPSKYDSMTEKARNKDFWAQLQKVTESPIDTGFPLLNNALGGGLYAEQLVFLGAVSSLGKTTYLLQLMDYIARTRPCLMFSYEMSSKELTAKSLSRYSMEIAVRDNIGYEKNALTMRQILTYYMHDTHAKAKIDLLKQANIEYLQHTGDNKYVIECEGDKTALDISNDVKTFISEVKPKQTPVIFIDYMQIMTPLNPHMTDKQNIDQAVKVLKQLARETKVCIIAISSLNRDNYSKKISMEAFKESGAIEYSSDILIGLQFKGTGEKNFDIYEAKKKDPRAVELHVLKNRNGCITDPIMYTYYPKFNYYREFEVVKKAPVIVR